MTASSTTTVDGPSVRSVVIGISLLLTVLAVAFAFGLASKNANLAAEGKVQRPTVAAVSAYAKAHGYQQVVLIAEQPAVFVRANGDQTDQVYATGRGSFLGIKSSSKNRYYLFTRSRAADLLLMSSQLDNQKCAAPAGGPAGVQICAGGDSNGLIVKLIGS